MTSSYKPDIDNYLDRITAIEQLIITDSVVVKNPIQVPMVGPYWLHIAGGGAPQKSSANQWLETYTIRILLIRGKVGAMGDYEIETQIMKDITNVSWYFMMDKNYRNLRIAGHATLASNQAGFDPDSVIVSNQARWQGAAVTGQIVGSIHSLSFRHRMTNRP